MVGTMITEAMLKSYFEKAVDFGISVLIALLILIIGRFVIKFILKVTKRIFDKSNVDVAVSNFLNSLLRFILYGVLIIIICDKVGIQTTSFIALLTSAGLAVGLALQGSLANFAGGVLILIMKPFAIGDYIKCELGEGEVIGIDIFYTKLLSVENLKIVIPNGKLADVSITNLTSMDKRMVRFTVGISYDCDIKICKDVLVNYINNHEKVLKDENNKIYLSEFGESSIQFEIRAWVPTDGYWDSYFDIKEHLKEELDKAGIVIAYNQLDVHIKEK